MLGTLKRHQSSGANFEMDELKGQMDCLVSFSKTVIRHCMKWSYKNIFLIFSLKVRVFKEFFSFF